MFNFKPNPKAQVSLKFVELFGKQYKPTVTGYRMSPLECKMANVPRGTYVTELVVEGQVLAYAKSTDWRRSYKLLKLEVEKLYTTG